MSKKRKLFSAERLKGCLPTLILILIVAMVSAYSIAKILETANYNAIITSLGFESKEEFNLYVEKFNTPFDETPLLQNAWNEQDKTDTNNILTSKLFRTDEQSIFLENGLLNLANLSETTKLVWSNATSFSEKKHAYLEDLFLQSGFVASGDKVEQYLSIKQLTLETANENQAHLEYVVNVKTQSLRDSLGLVGKMFPQKLYFTIAFDCDLSAQNQITSPTIKTNNFDEQTNAKFLYALQSMTSTTQDGITLSFCKMLLQFNTEIAKITNSSCSFTLDGDIIYNPKLT